MRIVEDDDAGYLAWVERNQQGFVVNTDCKPDPGYLIIHRFRSSGITRRSLCGASNEATSAV